MSMQAAAPKCMCAVCAVTMSRAARQCRELAAEEIKDKTRANFCGWFVPRPDTYQGGGAAISQASRSALDALFDPLKR